MTPIHPFLADLVVALDLLDTTAIALNYDLATGTLTVIGRSGETLATGTSVEDVVEQLEA